MLPFQLAARADANQTRVSLEISHPDSGQRVLIFVVAAGYLINSLRDEF